MGDLFGLKEHELRHTNEERHIRTLYEEVARLAIDVGALRSDLARLTRVVEGKVSAAEVDPAIVGLDAGLAEARGRLAGAHAASEDAWSDIYAELEDSIDEVRQAVDATTKASAPGADKTASDPE